MRNCAVATSAILYVLWFTHPALAQEPPTLRLTLDDAVARAMATSHRLAEARARERVAVAGVGAREAADRPTVAATAGYVRTNHVVEYAVPTLIGPARVLYPDVPNNYKSRLELTWPIYTSGQTDALERSARAEADAVAAEVSATQADLRLEVTRAYWAVVTAKAAVGVLEQGVARTQAHVAEVTARSRAGLVPPNELASATAQEMRARMLAIEARTLRDVAVAELARLIGAASDQPIEPADDLGPTSATFAGPVDVAPLLAAARADRQERRALQYRIAAAGEQRTAAAAGRLPMVFVSSGLEWSRPNPRIFPRTDQWDHTWDAGIGVTWSLWDGGRTSAAMAQAAGLVDVVTQRLEEFDSVLAVEVRQRSLEIESGIAAVAAASSGVEASAEARRVVEERYRAGVIAQIEVLDAEFALVQAELDRTRAAAAVRLAEARLARAIGR